MRKAKPFGAKEGESIRILLVDDHSILREGLAEILNRQPGLHVCSQADDSVQALAAIATCNPNLAIVDLVLKDRCGIELIKDIRVRHPGFRVLVLSMHDELVYAERVIRAGACGYITKQEAAAKIVLAVRHVFNGGIYLSDSVAAHIVAKLAGRLPAAAVENLADRELEVFELIGDGFSTQEIAVRLHLGAGTVETYRARIKDKLQLKDAHELLRSAIHWSRTEAIRGVPSALLGGTAARPREAGGGRSS